MRKIDRSAVCCPAFLTEARDYKNDLRAAQKQVIRDELMKLQGGCCAYCERLIGANNDEGHIEHFRRQCDHPHLSVEWSNLFWSCLDERTCGKAKDKYLDGFQKTSERAGVEAKLLHPGEDDPEDYLLFVFDGTVKPREGLSEDQIDRANRTLKAFGLADSAFLKRSREAAARPYVLAIQRLSKFGMEEVVEYAAEMLRGLGREPHTTAIKHYLRSVI